MPEQNSASGHWLGEIDRDGWLQPLSLDIDQEKGLYRGEWSSPTGIRSRPLENVEVQGDEVRFETDKLRFVGHVNGGTISGKVTNKLADAPVGEFSVMQDGARFRPAESEWSPEVIP
jgi:hypothetical protein